MRIAALLCIGELGSRELVATQSYLPESPSFKGSILIELVVCGGSVCVSTSVFMVILPLADIVL